MFEFNIFKQNAVAQDMSSWKQGFLPHVRGRRRLGRARLVDESSDKVNRLSRNMNDLGNRAKDQSDAFMVEQQMSWNDANLRDVRAELVQSNYKASLDARAEGSEVLQGAMSQRRSVASTAEAQASFNQRVEGFQAARKKLKLAQDMANNSQGTNVKHNQTGFEMLDTDIDQFYAQFDAQVDERREQYAQQEYGRSYEEMQNMTYEDYSGDYNGIFDITEEMFEVMKAEHSTNIDTMVLGDILGQDASEIYFLATGGMEDFSVADFLADTRTNFAEMGQATAEGANSMSEAENEARAKFAKMMEAEQRKTQALLGAETNESIAEQLKDLNSAEAAAKAKLDEQNAALTEGGRSRKKKVKGVSFVDTRPQ